jgi:hypothetical protein
MFKRSNQFYKITSQFRPHYALQFIQPLKEIIIKHKIGFLWTREWPVPNAGLTAVCEPTVWTISALMSRNPIDLQALLQGMPNLYLRSQLHATEQELTWRRDVQQDVRIEYCEFPRAGFHRDIALHGEPLFRPSFWLFTSNLSCVKLYIIFM